ncbi:hypothetical protein [Aeoliella sp. SH292]|uniref:hypothetical protein n=1 Tax=Aeoliella sp. SH292 TaxID=3454464 RepID=UPI003F98BF9D
MNRLPLLLLVATLALAPTATHAATAIWIGPENGSWSDPANWSTGAVPGSMDTAIVDDDAGTVSTVTANAPGYVNSLEIKEGDRLVVASQGAFRTGYIELAGTFRIDPGSLAETGFSFIIGPTGSVELSPGDPAQLVAINGASTLWWNHGAINGAGTIRPQGTFLNDGVLTADVQDALLDIYLNGSSSSTLITNNGVAKATNGGHLRFRYTSSQLPFITQSSTARIEAGPLSKVTLDRVQVMGGTLAALNDDTGLGTVDATDSVFANVRFEGAINVERSRLAGNIGNGGKLQVVDNVTLASDIVELSGHGLVQLGVSTEVGASPAFLYFANPTRPGAHVFRNLDNTIRGQGVLSLNGGALDNRAIIEAGYGVDGPQVPNRVILSIQGGAIANSGVLRSAANTGLGMAGTQVTNYRGDIAGTIEALPGGVVDLSQVSIVGGTIRAVTAGAGSNLPDGIVQSNSQFTKFSNLQLQGRIGSISSELTLDGRIVVDGSLQLRNLYLNGNVELEGGEIAIGESAGNIRLTSTAPSSTPISLTLESSILRLHNISNAASYLRLENQGMVVASEGKTATLPSVLVKNEGLIHAEANARLSLGAVESPSGTTVAEVRADENALISVTRLSGGTVISAAGTDGEPYSGTVLIDSFGGAIGLENVVNRGHIRVDRGTISGVIENHGVIDLGNSSVLQAPFALQFTGTGELRLQGRPFQQSTPFTGPTLINGPQHTIRTNGTIAYGSSTFVNQGIVQADTGILTIYTQSAGNFIQQGTLRTVGANTLNISLAQPRLNNDGNFDISPTGTLAISGTQQIHNRSAGDIVVGGTLTINSANLTNDAGATIRGGGTILGAGDTTINQSILTNHGLVAPGSTIGDLQILGNYVQSATGVLEIDVAGFEAGEFDQLLIETISASSGGLATLAGTLEFNFNPELIPALGDELVVLTAKEITGVFDTIEGLPALAVGLDWQIDYLPTMVMATVIGLTPPNLAGDFNGDGFVNLADYTVWRDGLGDSFAASDYDLWKQNFGRSANDPAPEANGPAAVPEPTAVLLALAFLPLLARRVRR